MTVATPVGLLIIAAPVSVAVSSVAVTTPFGFVDLASLGVNSSGFSHWDSDCELGRESEKGRDSSNVEFHSWKY
ncbi:hypothetical protein NP233_g11672 [Leucocoprinus birnbaumii]|uniref:Secreted protein n=1 Tax=Leucocoprinus birnbaumii TaxID=56174 RepID=A0AAD5VGP4_9AGAR|nr:hypothetical protein NP233_g11672 [Leucocoprinus birnbaumii]